MYFPCNIVCIIPEGILPQVQKVRALTIGQNCSAVCTNEGGHRDAFSSEWCEALRVSRPPSRSVLCSSLVEDHIATQEASVGMYSGCG